MNVNNFRVIKRLGWHINDNKDQAANTLAKNVDSNDFPKISFNFTGVLN